MYTPINWANPDNLKLIKQRKEAEHVEHPHIDEMASCKKGMKSKLIEGMTRVFAFRLKPNFEM